MKPCKACGQPRPLDDFGLKSGSRDGHTSTCKECLRARARASYRALRERVQAAGFAPNPVGFPHERLLTPGERLADARERAAAWRRQSPIASRAYYRQWRRARQRATAEVAALSGKRWTPREDAIAMREDIGLVEIATMLGRSWASVLCRRKALRAAAA
jgi:hypothetical protein